ncbi:MAG: DUF3168 domain-containing protein [Sphingomonas sp.]
MDWQEALLSRLTDDAALAALIAGRAYWVERPQQAALPAITLQLIADAPDQHMEGFQAFRASIVQIDCWAERHIEAAAMAEAVKQAAAPAGTFSGVRFGRSFVNAIRDLGDQGATKFIHRTSLDIRIWHC